MKLRLAIISLLVTLSISPLGVGRTWTDSTGRYTLDADLVAIGDTMVVVKRDDQELVEIPIEKLSDKDRKFLKSKEASDLAQQLSKTQQTWTLRDGSKLGGRIVDFTSRDMTVQRRRGRIYVNDRVLENLPTFYQTLIPQIVAQLENLQRSDRSSLEAWLIRQRGQARTFHLDGVLLETENGDEYAVPLTMFADEDAKLLKAGWDEWLAARRAEDYSSLEHQAFLLRSAAAARQHDRQVQRQIAQMNLKLQVVEVGLTSLWEVTLHPAAGVAGRSQWVVVPGRDSRQATANALEQFPGYLVGPVRRVAGNR